MEHEVKEHLTVDSVMTADGDRVELDTSVSLDVSVNGLCGDTVSADVTADAYIEDIKYCPFCGEEL